MSVKEYENVWRNSRPLLETADGAMAPWSTLERACHYVDSADYDALAAELAVEKMQHSVTIADEHESRSSFQDRIRALEAELANAALDIASLNAAFDTLTANLAAELALRKTAEAYAARNALRVIELDEALERYALNPPWDRVIELEEVLQEMLDVRGVNTQEAYDVRARARKTLGSTLYPIDTSAKPVEESAKDSYVAETPCRIKEHDGAFKCYAHNKSWGAISKPDAPCVGWSTKETKGDANAE